MLAAKAKIKQGEQLYAHLGSNIEFTCEIGHRAPAYSQMLVASPPNGLQQTYWYYNGNLLNYARTTTTNPMEKNFSIDWDATTQTSRFKLFGIQTTDAGNYTCKPTSAEPATIRLHVKSRYQPLSLSQMISLLPHSESNLTMYPTHLALCHTHTHTGANKGVSKDRLHNHGNGYHSFSVKEEQRNRQHYALDSTGSNGSELIDSGGYKPPIPSLLTITLISCLINLLLTDSRHH